MFGHSTNNDDFILALYAAKSLGNERRTHARENARTRSSVERLANQYRAALGRIEGLEAQLKRERAARLAAEMNLERRSQA